MKLTFFLITCIVLFFAAVAPKAGEDISLSAILDRTEIPFEETAELKLEIKWNGDIRSYAFEVLPLPELEKLKVLGTSSAISSKTEAGHEVTSRIFKYTLKPIESGTGIIKPIKLKCVSMPDSIPGELSTQELSIQIAPPVPVEHKSGLSIYFYLPVIIILIAGLAFVLLRMRRKPEIVPEKSPEDSVLEDLARIKEEGYPDRKLFFTRLFKILITYLEKKYNRNLAGLTAEMVVSDLENLEIPLDIKDKFSEWLIKAEKEKFAPFGGEPGDIVRLIAELEKFFGKNEISDKAEV